MIKPATLWLLDRQLLSYCVDFKRNKKKILVEMSQIQLCEAHTEMYAPEEHSFTISSLM